MTHSGDSSPLFESISNDIVTEGYSLCSDALTKSLANLLLQHTTELSEENIQRASIGRAEDHAINYYIRTDNCLDNK